MLSLEKKYFKRKILRKEAIKIVYLNCLKLMKNYYNNQMITNICFKETDNRKQMKKSTKKSVSITVKINSWTAKVNKLTKL